MKNFKGIVYAALSSSTFGLAPLFSILLLSDGFSSFEVLSYRWGVASLTLGIVGLAGGCRFRISRQELCTVFFLSLFRAATSLSLVIAYQNISSGVASIIHFMYPLAVALAMALFFHERISWRTAAAIGVSLAGVALLSAGGIGSRGGDTTSGTVAAAVSVFAYAGYIIGVRKSRAAQVESTTLTFYVMAFGALLFLCGGMFTGGVRLVTDGKEWLAILGLALPATAISNITLVRAIKFIGPTLTSIFGALEPLTAVAIGATVFGERFGWTSALAWDWSLRPSASSYSTRNAKRERLLLLLQRSERKDVPTGSDCEQKQPELRPPPRIDDPKDAIPHRQPDQRHGNNLRLQRYGAIFAEVTDIRAQMPLVQKPRIEAGRRTNVKGGGEEQEGRRRQQRHKDTDDTQPQEEAPEYDTQNFHGVKIMIFTGTFRPKKVFSYICRM